MKISKHHVTCHKYNNLICQLKIKLDKINIIYLSVDIIRKNVEHSSLLSQDTTQWHQLFVRKVGCPALTQGGTSHRHCTFTFTQQNIKTNTHLWILDVKDVHSIATLLQEKSFFTQNNKFALDRKHLKCVLGRTVCARGIEMINRMLLIVDYCSKRSYPLMSSAHKTHPLDDRFWAVYFFIHQRSGKRKLY